MASKTALSNWKHSKNLFSTQFSRNGERVLTSGSDKSVHLWQVGHEQPIRSWVHPEGVAASKFSRDESRVLTQGKNITLWDVGQNQPVVVLQPKSEDAHTFFKNATFLANDTKILAQNNYFVLWDVQVDESISVGQLKEEHEALSGTTMDTEGIYRKLAIDEWLAKRVAYRTKYPERWLELLSN